MENLYERQENEGCMEYKARLLLGKLDKTIDLDWSEIADLLGLDYSPDHLRKTAYGFKEAYEYYLAKLTDSINDNDILNELELKRIDFEKEKQRFYDQRTAYKKLIRGNARFDELKNIIQKSLNDIELYKPVQYKHAHSDNDLLIGLNDIHYGVEINNYWNQYNSNIAKERLEHYIQEIISIQKTHNSENCYITANGDLISGNIHYKIAIANRENVVQQIMGVSELLSWFISELSGHFANVYFSSVAGNHSRLSLKDKSPKDERLDDLIPFYIKARLQNLSNVHVIEDKIDNTINMINIRGKNYVMVHGDMDSLNGLLKLIKMLPEKIYAVTMGHLHHNTITHMQGIKIIQSGCLVGVDDYCIEKRILGKAQQLVCVCNNSGVKCSYDVEFG